ncbi:hypothetical protein TNCT_274741 [Trichonephila clavata]|uniref:Uncharacterized protein n=1 Tax=Trichonephila clavata TaxID=2740835 RepID=A0A8X6KVD3_TRICU|nr:hypothetical protein TNCT_274741 [Trichonephila clavata]
MQTGHLLHRKGVGGPTSLLDSEVDVRRDPPRLGGRLERTLLGSKGCQKTRALFSEKGGPLRRRHKMKPISFIHARIHLLYFSVLPSLYGCHGRVAE